VAVSKARQALMHSPMSTAWPAPTASITAMVSAANSVSAYACGDCGRSDRPFPRGSMVTTRKVLARYGTWAFQARE
jgi:hypothetical protein